MRDFDISLSNYRSNISSFWATSISKAMTEPIIRRRTSLESIFGQVKSKWNWGKCKAFLLLKYLFGNDTCVFNKLYNGIANATTIHLISFWSECIYMLQYPQNISQYCVIFGVEFLIHLSNRNDYKWFVNGAKSLPCQDLVQLLAWF